MHAVINLERLANKIDRVQNAWTGIVLLMTYQFDVECLALFAFSAFAVFLFCSFSACLPQVVPARA